MPQFAYQTKLNAVRLAEVKTVCDAFAPADLAQYERKFIIDTIFFPQLIVGLGVGFPFFRLHERLAKECCKIIVSKGCRSVPDEMDEGFGRLLAVYGGYRDSDVATASIITGPYSLFSEIVHQKHPTKIFSQVRHFYASINPPFLELPFSDDDYARLMQTEDRKVQVALPYQEDEMSFRRQPSIHSGAMCLHGLVQTRLFSAHDYAYSMSLPIEALKGWRFVYDRLFSSLRKEDFDLYKRIHKAPVADRTLRTLFGNRIGSLARLLDFEPVNPLGLLKGLPDPARDLDKAIKAREEVDDRILKIRERAEGFRCLVDKVHHSCLAGDAKTAADKLDELRGMKPSNSINRIIIDQLREFSSKNVVAKLEDRLDKQLTRKEDIMWFSRYVGYVGLVISALTLGACYLGLTPRLEAALAGARTALFPISATATILRSAIRFLPGFDVYAAFHEWPKAIRTDRVGALK